MGSGFSKKTKKKSCLLVLDPESSTGENINERGDFKEHDKEKVKTSFKDEHNMSNVKLDETQPANIQTECNLQTQESNIVDRKTEETCQNLDRVRKLIQELSWPSQCHDSLNSSSTITNFALASLRITNKMTQTDEAIWNSNAINQFRIFSNEKQTSEHRNSGMKLNEILDLNTTSNQTFELVYNTSTCESFRKLEEKNVLVMPDPSHGENESDESSLNFQAIENNELNTEDQSKNKKDSNCTDSDFIINSKCLMLYDDPKTLSTFASQVIWMPTCGDERLPEEDRPNDPLESDNDTCLFDEAKNDVALCIQRKDKIEKHPYEDDYDCMPDIEYLREDINGSRGSWEEIEKSD